MAKKNSAKVRFAAWLLSVSMSLGAGTAIGTYTADDSKEVNRLKEVLVLTKKELEESKNSVIELTSLVKEYERKDSAAQDDKQKKLLIFNNICSLQDEINTNLSNYANVCTEEYDTNMYAEYLNKCIKSIQYEDSAFLTSKDLDEKQECYNYITNPDNIKKIDSLKELLIRSKLQEAFGNEYPDKAIVYTYKAAEKALIVGYYGKDINSFESIKEENVPIEIMNLIKTQKEQPKDNTDYIYSNLLQSIINLKEKNYSLIVNESGEKQIVDVNTKIIPNDKNSNELDR